MDGCEGNLLTAMPEGHWVHVGQQWINMALVVSTDITGSEGMEKLRLYAVDAKAGDAWSVPLMDATPLLAYLSAHAYQA